MDWCATLLAAGGAAPDPAYALDGDDLTAILSGARQPYARTFFWRTIEKDAARAGKWKYVKEPGGEQLFDLDVDPGERNDLRAAHPDVFARIKTQFAEWNRTMLPRPVQ